MNCSSLDTALALRLLDTMLTDILPLTEDAVNIGNKVFGAALLRKSDMSTYMAATNNEIESPLHHGEMHLLKHYFDVPEDTRIPVTDLYFLATHEPCSLCLSAITWSGFDNFYFYFSHQESASAFSIPHDLRILKEVFDVDPGQYRQKNAFWSAHSIKDWVSVCENSLSDHTHALLNEKIQSIDARYLAASQRYQASKSTNSIPLN